MMMKINDLDNETRALGNDMIVVLENHRKRHINNRKVLGQSYLHEFEKPYFAQVLLLINSMPDSFDSIPFIESCINDFNEVFDLEFDFDLRSYSDKYLLDQYNAVLAQLELNRAAQKSYDQYKKNLEE